MTITTQHQSSRPTATVVHIFLPSSLAENHLFCATWKSDLAPFDTVCRTLREYASYPTRSAAQNKNSIMFTVEYTALHPFTPHRRKQGGPCVAGQYCPEGSPFWQACPGGSYCADATGAITGLCAAGYYCTQVGR